jgi:nucleoside-diphosphate-sugar epimerase
MQLAVTLRSFTTYGSRESLPYFIPEMIRQCLKEPKIQVGNLKTSRDFTYVDDTAEAMTAALKTESIEGETINIGTSKTWKMKDILTLIKKQTKTQEKPVTLDKTRLRPNDVKTLITDNSKAQKLLNWKPKTPFQEGLRKTIQWYLKNGKLWGYEKREWPWRY